MHTHTHTHTYTNTFEINLYNLEFSIKGIPNTISRNKGESSKLKNQKYHGSHFYVI